MIYLTKRDPQRNMARFYALDVQATLFGEWDVIREWGRINSAGQGRIARFPNEEKRTQRYCVSFGEERSVAIKWLI